MEPNDIKPARFPRYLYLQEVRDILKHEKETGEIE